MVTKKELVKDLRFCKELMDRLVEFADGTGDTYFTGRHSVIQSDIKRLRRELNAMRKKLNGGLTIK